MEFSQNLLTNELESIDITMPLSDSPKLVELVGLWGNSASISLLDADCHIYTSSLVDGVIGYRMGSSCVTVFGDPLCAPEDMHIIAKEFQEVCEEKGWSIIYLAVSKKFAFWACENGCSSLVEVGEELFLDPYKFSMSGSKGRALRNKVNLAQRAGIEVVEYCTFDAQIEKSIEEVGASWINARQGPQIYLAHMQLFAERAGKRWFYATQEGKTVGVLLLQRLESHKGWLVQFLMSTPDSPQGTSEQLIVTALNSLRQEGCRFFTFGVAQRKELGEIMGLNKISEMFGRLMFKIFMRLFHLDQRRRYWRKFLPQQEPSYVVFSSGTIGIREIKSLMKALNVSF